MISKRVRYSNYVVSRKDLEEVLAKDSIYQSAVERARMSREASRKAEEEREEITHANTVALPQEKEASRLERAVVYTRQRLRDLKQQRDRQRIIANKARVRANTQMRREVSSAAISLKRCYAEMREALETAESRKAAMFQKLYTENYRETLQRAGVLGEEMPGEDDEDFTDESLGLLPPEEIEEEDASG